MEMSFTPQDGAALYGLLVDNSSDIILRTDCHGFIQRASPAIFRIGLPQDEELFGRHLTDVFHPRHASAVRLCLAQAIAGEPEGAWQEFSSPAPDGSEHWFEIRMRGVTGDSGAIVGALSVMRSVDDRKAVERQLFVATMTDPLTGLTNRTACTAMLAHMIERGEKGCVAIFDVDHFKAINLRHGQSVGDRILVAFGDYIRSTMRDSDIISRIGGESVGVLLPGLGAGEAEAICQRIVSGIAELGRVGSVDAIPLTASAGVARIAGSVDDTLRRAELALALAKAKGRNRLEMENGQPVC